MIEIKLILTGKPITKKNHQTMVIAGNGRRYLIQSEPYRKYEENCLWQIKAQYRGETITDQINLQALYYMPTKARPDLVNLLQATCDILQKAKVIENDKNIVSFDGSKIIGIDKINPRVEIIIEIIGNSCLKSI